MKLFARGVIFVAVLVVAGLPAAAAPGESDYETVQRWRFDGLDERFVVATRPDPSRAVPARSPRSPTLPVTASVRSDPEIDLGVAITITPNPTGTDYPTSFVITIDNAADSVTAPTLVRTRSTYSGLLFDGIIGNDWVCDAADPLDGPLDCTYTGSSLAPGEQQSLVIMMRPQGTGNNRDFTTSIEECRFGVLSCLDLNPSNDSLTVFYDVSAEIADISIVMPTVEPEPVPPGDDFTLSTEVFNNGPGISTLESLDVLFEPSELVFIGGFPSCAEIALGNVRCDFFSETLPVAAGAPVQLEFSASVMAAARGVPGCLILRAETSTPDPNPENNELRYCVPLVGPDDVVDLSITKTSALSEVNLGETIAFEITVSSDYSSTGTAASVRFVDTVPEGLTLTDISTPSGWSCQPSGNDVLCVTHDPFGPGSEAEITLFFEAVQVGVWTNRVDISSCLINDDDDCFDPDTTNNAAEYVFEVLSGQPVADLALSVERISPPGVAQPNEPVIFEIGVENPSTEIIGPVSVTVQVPVGLVVDGADGLGWTCDLQADPLLCVKTDLPVLSVSSFELEVRGQTPGEYVVSAGILDCNCSDPNPDNNSSASSVQIVAASADVSLQLTLPEPPPQPGDSFFVTATLLNAGPDPSELERLVIEYDSEYIDLVEAPAGLDCSPSTPGVMRCLLTAEPPLALGDPRSYQALFEIPIGLAQSRGARGGLCFDGLVETLTSDPEPGNNTDTVCIGTGSPPAIDISLDKQALDAVVVNGETTRFRVTVRNEGGGVPPFEGPTRLEFVDRYEGMVYAGFDAGPEWSCVEDQGEVVCSYFSLDGPLSNVGGFSSVELEFTVATQEPTALNSAEIIRCEVDPQTDCNDPNPDNDQSQASVEVLQPPPPDAVLTLATAVDPSSVDPGSALSVDLDVNNAGPGPASLGQARLSFDPGLLRFDGTAPGDPPCAEQAPGVVECPLNALLVPAGQSVQFGYAFTYQPAAVRGGPPPILDEICIEIELTTNSSPQPEPALACFVSGGPPPDPELVLTKDASVAAVTIGDSFHYLLTVENSSTLPLSTLTVVDPLPAELGFLGASSNDFSCQLGPGNVVQCLSSLNFLLQPGDTTEIRIDVQALGPPGLVENTATATVFNTLLTAVATATVELLAASNSADLALGLSFDPTTVVLGDASLLSASIENLGPDAAIGLGVNFVLPTGFTAGAPSPGWDCQLQGPILSCVWLSQLLDAGDSLVLELPLTPPAIGSYVIGGSVGADTDDPDPNNNAAEADLIVTAPQTLDLALTGSSEPASVAAGGDFAYALFVANVGDSVATSVQVIVDPPSGTSFLGVVGPQAVCAESAGLIICNLAAPLLPQETLDLEVLLRAPNVGGVLSGSASVQADGTDIDPSNNTIELQTTLIAALPTADLALALAFDPSSVESGAATRLVATVNNLGPDPAGGIGLVLTLPEAFVAAATSAGWTCQSQGQAKLCQLDGVLPAGSAETLEISGTASLVGSFDAVGEVGGAVEDPQPANNQAQAPLEVRPAGFVDLALTAEGNPSSAAAGVQVTFALSLRNLGDRPASGLFVDIALGSALELIQTPAGWTCSAQAGVQRCLIPGSLAPAGLLQAALSGLVIDVDGSGLSRFEVGFDGIDANPANNVAEVVTALQRPVGADLRIQKTASSASVAGLASFAYRLEVENLGPAPAVGVTVTDTLPAGIEFLGVRAPGWICSGQSTVVCTLGAPLSVGLRSAIEIDVRAPATQGIIVNRATVSAQTLDPEPSNNEAQVSVSIGPLDRQVIEERLTQAAGDDPVAGPLAGPVAGLCARGVADVQSLCQALAGGSDGEVRRALREIAPTERTSQANALQEISRTQFFNVDARLNELRGGGGGFSTAGLAWRHGQQLLPLSVFSLTSAGADPVGDGLVSPWGFFLNGTLSTGDRRDTLREIGYDFETHGLTAGVDYRFSPQRVLGLAVGYHRFDSDYTNDSRLRTRGATLTGYGSIYANDQLYFDLRLSAGRSDFDQQRRIRFGIGGLQVDRVALGSTDATQYTAAAAMGYHLNVDRLSITPSLSARYVRNTVDGFTETGAGALSMRFDRQVFASTQYSANLHVSRPFSTTRGVFSPQFDLAWHRETRNAGLELIGRFVDAPESEVFRIRGEDFDRSYGSAALGLVWVGPHGRQAYVNIRELFSADGLSRRTINVGARFEF